MAVVVVATIKPKDGLLDEVVEIYKEAIPAVHQEPGCQLYALHRGKDRLVMVEQWESAEALAVHAKAPALAAAHAKTEGKLDGPADVLVTEAVPAGEPAKGVVGG